MPELLSALLTARPGPQQPDLVLDTETGDQKQEDGEEEWRLDQDQAAVCDTSGCSLPAGSVLATLQAAQQGHFGGAEEAFLSLMAEGDTDYSTLMEVITGAEMAGKKTVPADVLTRLKLLQRMAVATTSNGVSVVVTLRRDEERQCGGGGGGGGWVMLNGRRFRYKISLIDIELKPLASKPDENNKRHFIQRGCQKHSHSICYVCNSSIVSGKPDLSAVLTPWAFALIFALGGLGWAGLRRTGINAWA